MKSSEKDTSQYRSALKVNAGVEQPANLNKHALERIRLLRNQPLTASQFHDGILSGNRSILSRAITLVESALPSHYQLAQEVIQKCLPHSGNSLRIGITGVPGAGKSTFIETYGLYLISKGHKTAVLAIDPSSQISKGSILGDKTRMEKLSNHDMAFIRPSPTAGSLGGVARKTREIIILCEAAGFDRILVETVGVGQSETAVHSMVDYFLLLMLSGAGDELQGIKRGIMEMCDAIAINKADGENLVKAQIARVQYQNALHLFPPHPSGIKPVVELCSALHNSGINNIASIIESYHLQSMSTGYFDKKRKIQQISQLYDTINQYLTDHFHNNNEVKNHLPEILSSLDDNRLSPYQAAQQLLDKYFSEMRKGE